MAVTQMYAVGCYNHMNGKYDVKAVMASDWRESFAKAFPTYEAWLKEAEDEQGRSLSYEEARDVALNQDWDFIVDVLEGIHFGDPVQIISIDVKREQDYNALTAEELSRITLPETKR